MPRYEKKVKINANLVKKYDEEYYRVLDDVQMRELKFKGHVRPEGKVVETRTHIISYYIEVD
jgi:hypothetical protein